MVLGTLRDARMRTETHLVYCHIIKVDCQVAVGEVMCLFKFTKSWSQ